MQNQGKCEIRNVKKEVEISSYRRKYNSYSHKNERFQLLITRIRSIVNIAFDILGINRSFLKIFLQNYNKHESVSKSTFSKTFLNYLKQTLPNIYKNCLHYLKFIYPSLIIRPCQWKLHTFGCCCMIQCREFLWCPQ